MINPESLHGRRIPSTAQTPSAILLHPSDNVVCLLRDHVAGEKPVIVHNESDMREGPALTANVPLGHKVALGAIPAYAEVIKYGARIGQATQDIGAGEHVHLHNLEGQAAHGQES